MSETARGDKLGEWGHGGSQLTLYRYRLQWRPGDFTRPVIIPLESVRSVAVGPLGGDLVIVAGGETYRIFLGDQTDKARAAIVAVLP